ncbi:MAG: XdhC family protein [Fusobacterium sp.]|nr:XdhC family protein [Fusobacterium sp.]
MIDLIKEAKKLFLEGTPFVMTTITFKQGSAPRDVGSTMLVTEKGWHIGSIGGGEQEFNVINYAKELIAQKKSADMSYKVPKDIAANSGMICGGRNTVHYEYVDPSDIKVLQYLELILEKVKKQDVYLVYNTRKDAGIALEISNQLYSFTKDNDFEIEDLFKAKIKKPMQVFIFGGGHMAKAVSTVLSLLDLQITVIDDRADFLKKEDFPNVDIKVMDFYKLDELDIRDSDYVCIMTRGHKFDLVVLEHALKKNPYYIGVVGNIKKAKLYRDKFVGTELESVYDAKVHLPIGIKIKALTPHEIAVSIAGEMIESYRGNK